MLRLSGYRCLVENDQHSAVDGEDDGTYSTKHLTLLEIQEVYLIFKGNIKFRIADDLPRLKKKHSFDFINYTNVIIK